MDFRNTFSDPNSIIIQTIDESKIKDVNAQHKLAEQKEILKKRRQRDIEKREASDPFGKIPEDRLIEL